MFWQPAPCRPQAQSSLTYKIIKTIPIGAPDRWDYVVLDPSGTQAYVSHGPDLTVVDLKAGKVAGTIHVGGVTHGAAAIPALGKGYTDDGQAGMAVAFDLKTLKELKRIKVEPDADGIVYDAVSGHVLVITGDSGKVEVIDPKSDSLVASIDGGGPLEFGVLGGNGKFYVDGEDKNEIVRMDLGKNAADAHWPLTGCKTPHGLAIDRAHMRLFASCGNKVMDVVDANTGKVLASLPIGAGTDFAEFDAKSGIAFSSNRDGTLSMVTEKRRPVRSPAACHHHAGRAHHGAGSRQRPHLHRCRRHQGQYRGAGKRPPALPDRAGNGQASGA